MSEKQEGIGNHRWKGGRSRGYILKKAREGWFKKNLPYRCEICGKYPNGLKIIEMIFHHKDRNQFNNNPTNILLVCFGCHSIIHNRGRSPIKKPRNCVVCNKKLIGKQLQYCSYSCWYDDYYKPKFKKPNYHRKNG